MYGRILVPIDGSATSKRGLMEAIQLAKEQRAKLGCLYVVDEHIFIDAPSAYPYIPDLIESIRDAGKKILAESSEQVQQAGIPVESILRDSGGRRVSGTILDEAKSWPADLIVMGTHGRRGLSHLALGSDAERVVRESPVPVLLVRAAE